MSWSKEATIQSQYISDFFAETILIIQKIDLHSIEKLALELRKIKLQKGRIFLCGSGGGAGHASHAACDFRKLLKIESYSVTDNVSELTARINDDSWENSYVEYLKASNFNANDGVFVFSVGGGDKKAKISMQLVSVMEYAKQIDASVMGIVGRSGGHLKQISDACVVIPEMRSSTVTAQTEGLQSLVWHLILGHPLLEGEIPKWESLIKKK